jgi:hypothetical protein
VDVEQFIQRWTSREGGAERANYQMFLSELCDVLGVDRPQPAGAETAHNAYVFERAVRPRASETTTAPKRIDLYKKGAFILEAKQSRLPGGKNAIPTQQSLLPDEDLETLGRRARGPSWDVMMQNARKQAEGYVFLLEADQPAPPFIITCDVGHCLEVFADFTGTGRAYIQFPDRNGFRIYMDDLRKEGVRKRLACIWTDPHALDPTKTSARVTREIAKRLAEVSKALEARDCNPEDVAHFLMRCLFTMFAEDTDLLPKGSFRDLLQKCVDDPAHFPHRLKTLWQQMEKGEEFSHVIEARVRHFNGGLFKDTTVFELGREEIGELLAAAKADWRQVDPAIFGTLLEQALDKDERRRLGAHYTPRSYVQRLVDVTVMEPLREDWQAALTKAQQARDDGDGKQAVALIRAFHHKLCTTRVLDPACGTGNFLYVSLEMMKQLEGEVLQTLTDLGDRQASLTMTGAESVDPHQFLGLELNPRAAAIAELVIWIGYLQWHYRNHETHPAEPILKVFQNINFGHREGYDAVLTWDGYPLPALVEREGKRTEAYPNARRPAWPETEFIVGNPPFIGNKRMIANLGAPYVQALRSSSTSVAASVDLVMYWWDRAAELLSRGQVRRIGFVTTNSITMTFNRGVLDRWLSARNPISILYAVPDHPWVEGAGAADVRIAMTVCGAGKKAGLVQRVVDEKPGQPGSAVLGAPQAGPINSRLGVGVSLGAASALKANEGLSFMGVIPVSLRFVLSDRDAELLGIDPKAMPKIVRPYLGGRALKDNEPAKLIIDFFGHSEREAREQYPKIYQYVLDNVKPFRDTVNRRNHRENWWIFGEPRPGMRSAISNIDWYISTTETSKHRWFTKIPSEVLPDQKIRVVASDDDALLAVMNSRFHTVWSSAVGGRVGKGNDPVYNNTLCFDPFPFPPFDEPWRPALAALGFELDDLRKRVLRENPDLNFTDIYNVVDKIRREAELTPVEEAVNRRAQVSIIVQLHNQIDALTAQAYGWPTDLSDELILEWIVALNAERADEEASGRVRWLRPDYQVPRFATDVASKSGNLNLGDVTVAADKSQPAFPIDRYEQPLAIEAILSASGHPMNSTELARSFKRGGKRIEQRVVQVLTTLARYGRVTALPDGRFVARRAA